MRFSISLLAVLFSVVSGSSQILNPVSWSYNHQHLDGDVFELTFNAEIDEGWAIYSQYIDEGGPVPTSFIYEGETSHYELVEKNEEKSSKRKEGKEKLFDNMVVVKFLDDATFTQKIKVSDFSKPITGYLEFMTCNDESCLPPKGVDFSFSINAPLKSNKQEEQGGLEQRIDKKDNQDKDQFQEDIPSQALSDLQQDQLADGKETPAFSINNPEEFGSTEGQDDENANIKEPVKIDYQVKHLGGNKYEFSATAVVAQGYNVYSKDQEGGPGPTEFIWESEDDVVLTGELKESSDHISEGYDQIFDEQVIKIKNSVIWSQEFTADNPDARIKGYISYTACDAEACTFHDKPFDLDLAGEQNANANVIPLDGKQVNSNIAILQETFQNPLGDCGEKQESNKSLLWVFILGFLGGLVALLTPCVFPMIPLTVSYFTKGSKDRSSGIRNGLIYGASIIVIYVAIGILITAVFGATALNQLSTNWIANTIFFLIFVAFAFSFFGYYEITLPSSWSTKTDSMADKGGLIGIFFMAFTLALVSFSCTGPIIGSAIVESATSKIGPAVVMLGFSTALALPFGLFAAFPAWLNSLPQSGGWMNSVKVILGFLELALAFKFLSVADMTSHWGFLRYELFLGIWIIIGALMAIYLFGGIKFPHDSPKVKLSAPRIVFALAAVAFTVYCAMGFRPDDRTKTYDSLSILSGIVPPPHYNFFKPLPDPDPIIKARFPSFDKCANNLDCFKDYYEALAYAKEINKPVFIDFTGYGCVNCRKVEDQIWVKDKVWKLLSTDYVMASLYVDDRKKLDEVQYSTTTGDKMRNVGHLWADFQIANFKQNSQPLYVLITPDQRVLSIPKTYIPSEGSKEYAEYLECGLDQFMKHYDKEVIGAR